MTIYDRQFRDGKYNVFVITKEGFKMMDYGMYKDRKLNESKNKYGVKQLSRAALDCVK